MSEFKKLDEPQLEIEVSSDSEQPDRCVLRYKIDGLLVSHDEFVALQVASIGRSLSIVADFADHLTELADRFDGVGGATLDPQAMASIVEEMASKGTGPIVDPGTAGAPDAPHVNALSSKERSDLGIDAAAVLVTAEGSVALSRAELTKEELVELGLSPEQADAWGAISRNVPKDHKLVIDCDDDDNFLLEHLEILQRLGPEGGLTLEQANEELAKLERPAIARIVPVIAPDDIAVCDQCHQAGIDDPGEHSRQCGGGVWLCRREPTTIDEARAYSELTAGGVDGMSESLVDALEDPDVDVYQSRALGDGDVPGIMIIGLRQ